MSFEQQHEPGFLCEIDDEDVFKAVEHGWRVTPSIAIFILGEGVIEKGKKLMRDIDMPDLYARINKVRRKYEMFEIM